MSCGKSLKVIIVGDRGVGKTTFMKRYTTGDFVEKYNMTKGVSVNNLEIENVTFNCWDISGDKNENNTEYYKDANAAIVMFDVTSRHTFKSVNRWRNDIKKVCGDIPIILCANKVDYEEQYKVKTKEISQPFFYTSSKSNYNYEEPFRYLISKMK